jgi:CMP/dCMP kinase
VTRRGLVVALDGPSGAGKSSAGRALASRLGYTYIDTGAMYRALALKAMRAGAALDSETQLLPLAQQVRIELSEGQVHLDGEDVTTAIRSQEVSGAASSVSVHPGVRREMVARQQAMGEAGAVVLDGRDIATAVFPDAEVKIYVDADPRVRAERRHAELRAAGQEADLAAVEREVRERDWNDSHRADSPLTRAPEAVRIDTTGLSLDEVVARMLEVVERVTGQTRAEDLP